MQRTLIVLSMLVFAVTGGPHLCPFLGGGSEAFGAATDSDNDWNARFNINVGYYF
jgi:hypothetical protein